MLAALLLRVAAPLLLGVRLGAPCPACRKLSRHRRPMQESIVRGSVHATEAAWEGILHPSNSLLDPEQPTDFPPEEGPFRFVPNRFTRKQ